MLHVLRTNYISSQDSLNDFSWKPLLSNYTNNLSKEEITESEKDSQKVFQYLIWDKMNDLSAYNNITQARENARAIQDHITKEVWQCLNNYYHYVREQEIKDQIRNGDPVTAIDQLMRFGLLFTGTIKNTMTRDEGYTFLHLGKFLERAILTIDITRMKLNEMDPGALQPVKSRVLRYLLYSLFGYEIYTKTYKGHFSTDQVLELIVYNNFFPHSILYSLYQMNKYFERLKPESLPENFEELEFLIGKLLNNVKYSNIENQSLLKIDQFLFQTRTDLVEIAGSFNRYYFGNT